MKPGIFRIAIIAFSVASCREKPVESPPPAPAVDSSAAPDWKAHPVLGHEVIREFPHDTSAFTQGFLLAKGAWIESTGGYGTSSMRRVEKATGKVLVKRDLPEDLFGEGAAELAGKIYQLTWTSGLCLVYDADTLERAGEFAYEGEGWGLTSDGKSLIMSDGSDRLRYLDPKTFRVLAELPVRINGKPVNMLNELEYVEGEIFANVWHAEQIVRINPRNGNVIGVIDLSGVDAGVRRLEPEHVLNGIAYDPEAQELFVTGKCWPKIYQIRLVPKR